MQKFALCFNVSARLSAIKRGHEVTPLDRGLLWSRTGCAWCRGRNRKQVLYNCFSYYF